MSCINRNTVEFRSLLDVGSLSPEALAAKVSVWLDNNPDKDFPTFEDLFSEKRETKKDFTRLYRAESEKGVDSPAPAWLAEQPEVIEQKEAEGRWFYKSYEEAKEHADKFGSSGITYVDIPTDQVESFNARDNKFAGGYGRDGKEYFISKEYSATKKPYNNNSKATTLTTTTKDLLEILQKVQPNFRVELLANINDKALVDWERQLIRISEDGDFNDLNEELVHIFVEMLPESLKTSLDKEVINTKIYGEVFETYKRDSEYIKEDGTPNIEKIKREAVGQLITNLLNGTPISRIVPTGYIGKIKQLLDKFFAYIRGNIDPFQTALEYINAGKLIGDVPKTGVMKSKISLKEDGHTLSILAKKYDSDQYENIDLNNPDISKVYISGDTLVGGDTQNFISYLAACIKTNNFSKLSKIVITEITRAQLENRIETMLTSPSFKVLATLNSGKQTFVLDDFLKSLLLIEVVPETVEFFRQKENRDKVNDIDNSFSHLFGKTLYADRARSLVPVTSDNSDYLSRYSEITSIQSITSMVKELESILKSASANPTNDNKLRNLVEDLTKRVYADGLAIEKLSGTGVYDLTHPALSRQIIGNLKTSQDLVEKVFNVVQYLMQLQTITNTIRNYHLAPNAPNTTTNPLKDQNKLNNLLALRKFVGPWNKTLSSLREFNKNEDNELTALLNSISGNISDIENLSNKITKKEIAGIVQKRLKVFNDKLESDYAPKLAELHKLGLTEELDKIKEEIKGLQYSMELSLNGDTFAERLFSGELGDLVGGVEKGTNFITGALSSVSNSITTFSDQYLVNLSQAHDPILAVIGEHMDKVVNQAVISFNQGMENRLKAQPLVDKAGGSIKVGQDLSVIEDRLVRVEKRNFNKNISFFVTESRPTAVFVNQYGSRENYEVIIDDVPIKLSQVTYGVINKIFTDHGVTVEDYTQGLKYQQLIDTLDTLNEYSLITDQVVTKEELEAAIKDISEIKKTFEDEWFSNAYIDELHDLLSLRYIFDKKQRESFKIYKEEYETKSRDLEVSRNLLRFFTGDPESEQNLRESLALRASELYKLRSKDTPEGKMLDEFLVKKESYRESKNNYTLLFNKMEQMYDNQSTRPFVKSKLKEILRTYSSSNPKNFLAKIVQVHLETSDPSHLSNSDVVPSDIMELNAFLDDVVYYRESKEFKEDKDVITDELSEIEMMRNPSKFYLQVGKRISGERKILGRSMTSSEVATFNSMFDLQGNPSLPVVDSLLDGRKTQEGRYLFKFPFPVNGVFNDAYVLMEKGKPVHLSGSSATDAYLEISEITKKYRVSNLNQVDLSVADQKRVTELTQILEFERDNKPDTFEFVDEGTIKASNKRRRFLFEELENITSKYYRENYYTGFKKVLNDYNGVSHPMLKDFLKASRFMSRFRTKVQTELANKSEELETLVRRLDNNDPHLNEQDRIVLTWIKNNHAFGVRSMMEGDGSYSDYRVLIPARNHIKTIPRIQNFDRHYTANLSGTYHETIYKDSALNKNYKDTKNRRLARKIQPSEVTEKFNALTPELKEIHKLMVEGVHIAEQSKKSMFIGKDSYLWYDMPTVYKRAAELGVTSRVFKLIEKLKGNINPLEEGVVGAEVLENENSVKGKIKQNTYSYLESLRQRSLGNIEKLGKRDRHESFFDRKIPVDYSGKMDGNNVSMDFMSSVTDYGMSLNKAYHYSENVAIVEGAAESIDEEKTGGTSKRKDRIEKYLEQIIFRRNVGSKGFAATFLRFIRSTMVLGSQTIFNPAGGVKNLVQSFISNYMFSPPNAKHGWKPQPTDTLKTLEWLTTISKDRIDLNKEESLQSFLVRRVNPNNSNISELLSSDLHAKDFKNSYGWLFALQAGGERLVTYQLMISTFNSLYFTTEKGNEETQVQFMDLWENNNGKWTLKEAYDKEGNRVTEEVFADIKRYVNNFKFNTTGHGEKGVFLNSEIGKNLFFFMNFLVPTILNGFTNNRRNFVENRVTENLHISLVKNSIGMLSSLLGVNGKINHWSIMTMGEKRDFIKGIVLYSSMLLLYLIIRKLFGYDPDDEDKLAELKDMSQIEAWMILPLVKTIGELESQSFISFTSAHKFPIITQNETILSNPMLMERIKKLWRFTEDVYSRETYKTSNSALEIKEGEYKFLRELQSFVPFNPFHSYNPDLDPIQSLRNLEGAKNR